MAEKKGQIENSDDILDLTDVVEETAEDVSELLSNKESKNFNLFSIQQLKTKKYGIFSSNLFNGRGIAYR